MGCTQLDGTEDRTRENIQLEVWTSTFFHRKKMNRKYGKKRISRKDLIELFELDNERWLIVHNITYARVEIDKIMT